MTRHLKLVAAALAAAALGAFGTGNALARASGLSVFEEPQAGTKPFTSLITSAKSSIDLTMYELTDKAVEHDLVAAAKRGVTVRVLLNKKDPFESASPNTAAASYLTANGVKVRYAPGYFALTHQKTLTVDSKTSEILTLNLDAGYSSTRDFGVIDSQPADVQAISAAFNADWSGKKLAASDGTGDLVWSPGASAAVMDEINSAHRSIELENEEMDYWPATDALCAAAKRGVDVKIVMTYSHEWASAFKKLVACGAHIHVFYGQSYYIHAKALIVDSSSALVGSQNLSTESLVYNRELGIEVRTPGLVDELDQWFSSDYSKGAVYS